MDFSIRVDPEHFAYLRLQKGSLDRYADQREEWQRHYETDLRETYQQIAPWLPPTCDALLDVGSGLGGIDILIRRHYAERGQSPRVSLLDGHNDPPVMTLHRRTFNDMRQARNFQVKNGIDPFYLGAYKPDVASFDNPFDLICSFGSWCFHFPPMVYLCPVITSGLKPSTVVILDVRRHKLEWMRDLERVLELVTIVAAKPKWSRCVFKVRATQ